MESKWQKKWTYWQDSILSFHERRRTHTHIIIMNRQSFEREEMKKKSAWNLKNSIKVMSNQQTSQPTRRLWEIYYSYKWIVWLNGLRWNRQTKKTKKKNINEFNPIELNRTQPNEWIKWKSQINGQINKNGIDLLKWWFNDDEMMKMVTVGKK